MAEGTGLIKRFYEDVIGGGQLHLIDELATDDIADHEEGLPGQPSGREGVKFFVGAMREAFPDIRPKSVEPMMADGNLEAARVILTGTHEGELMGVGATGKTVEFESIDIIRVEDGKVAEHWGLTDTMGLMQQLGAIPE
jgi:predicted ester cyclase